MAEQKQAIQPNTKVLAQFIRDLSFENILAQKGLDTNTPPDIKVQVNLDAKKRTTDNQYEVLIKLSVVSSAKKETSEPSDDTKKSKLFVYCRSCSRMGSALPIHNSRHLRQC